MITPKKSPTSNMDPVTVILYPELENVENNAQTGQFIEHFADLASGMLETTRTKQVDTSRMKPLHREIKEYPEIDEQNLTRESDMFSPRFGGTGTLSLQELQEQKNQGHLQSRFRIPQDSPEEELRKIISSDPSAKKKLEDREELVNFLKCSQSPIDPFAHPLSLMKEIDQVKAMERGLSPLQPLKKKPIHQPVESFGDSSIRQTPFNEPLDSPHCKPQTPNDRSKKRHISVIDLAPSIHQAGPSHLEDASQIIYEQEDECILGYRLLLELLVTFEQQLKYNGLLQFLTVKDCLKLSATNRQLSKAITRRTVKRVIRLGNLDPELREAFWIYQAPFFTQDLTHVRIQQNVRIRLNLGDIFDNVYDRLIQRIEPNYDEAIGHKQLQQIQRDVGRTFDRFKGHDELFRILAAMAYVLPDIGYCQGMNFIAGALLEQLEDEQQAFWIMLSLIINKKMKKLLIPGVPSLHMRIYQMNQLMQKHVPELLAHFNQQEIGIDYFTTKWIMTVFTSFFNFEALPPVLDYFFLDGWKGIFKMAIAILKYLEFEFKSMDLMGFARFFRECKSYPFKMRHLLEMAADTKITNRQLNKMTQLFYINEAESKLKEAPDPSWPPQMDKIYKRMKNSLKGLEEETNDIKSSIVKDLQKHDEKLQVEHTLLRQANRMLSKVNQEFKQVLNEKQALELTSKTLKEELVYAKEDAKLLNKKAGFWKGLFVKKKKPPHTAGPSVEKGKIETQTTRLEMMTQEAKGALKKKLENDKKTLTARTQGNQYSPRNAISPPSAPPPPPPATGDLKMQTLFTEMPQSTEKNKVKELEKQVREIEKRLKKSITKYQKLKKEYDRRLTEFNDKSLAYEEVRQKKEFFKDQLNKVIITMELKKQDVLKDLGERIQMVEDSKCTISF